MRRMVGWVGAGIACLVLLVWWWQTPRPVGIAALAAQVDEFTLDNGMRWFLVDRGEAPVVTGLVQVKAGGLDELPGKAGVAHMFEHMAFKGSPDIGTTDAAAEQAVLAQIVTVDKEWAAATDPTQRAALAARRAELTAQADRYVVPNEVWQLLHEQGAAVINANTSKDATTYYVEMPNTMTGLWTYVTSQMIGRPVLRQFYQERDVVMEERRSSVDNSQIGRLYEAMLRTAFTASPYRLMTIGSMRELTELTMSDALAFYAAHYRTDRMVGVLVGKFDHAAAKRGIRRFFGALPSPGPDTSVPPLAAEPPQTNERRVSVQFDSAPLVMLAYHKPTLPHRDDYVFDVLSQVLCGGDAGMLVRRLRTERQLVRSIGCTSGMPGARAGNLFVISAQPLGEHTVAEVVTAIEEELAAVRTTAVGADLLTRAATNLRAASMWELNTNTALAKQLAFFQTMAGDWRYLLHHADVIATITPEEVRDVAARYLQPTQRTIAESTR